MRLATKKNPGVKAKRLVMQSFESAAAKVTKSATASNIKMAVAKKIVSVAKSIAKAVPTFVAKVTGSTTAKAKQQVSRSILNLYDLNTYLPAARIGIDELASAVVTAVSVVDEARAKKHCKDKKGDDDDGSGELRNIGPC